MQYIRILLWLQLTLILNLAVLFERCANLQYHVHPFISLLKVPEHKSVISHTHRTLSKSAHEMRTEDTESTSDLPTHSQTKKDGLVEDEPISSNGEMMSDSELKLATL